MNKLYNKILLSIKHSLNESLLDDIYDDDINLNTGDITDNLNGYTLIDLDLPSGTLWSDKNLGANSETDIGLLYQWGCTEGKNEGLCNFYHYPLNPLQNGKTFTKYNKKHVVMSLDNEDDAAYIESKGELSIPMKWQFDELIKKCNWKYTTINNISGYKVTSKNKNNKSYIFLPLNGGLCGNLKINDRINSFAHYWSKNIVSDPNLYSILRDNNKAYAYNLYFSSDYNSNSETPRILPAPRCDGNGIRAVSNKNLNTIYKNRKE